ncbi:MAG TPA: hypothetical protein VKA57_15675, partial [Solirubrobacteraceae bacterium]|nr:hypothetical protein [Solirubrobacteraceae bacterium]
MSVRWLVAVCLAVAMVGVASASALAYPSAKWTCNGSPCIGWFTSNVHLVWDVKAGTPSTPTSCENAWIVNDITSTERTCVLVDSDGEVTFKAYISLDKTAPTVTSITPDRLPDHVGWYTHPVTFAVQGSDLTSGLDGCDT